MKTCYIAGAGECSVIKIKPDKSDIVIAADGGLRHLERASIKPDYIIGDFDSLGFVPEGSGVIRLKPEKDDTDMDSAVKKGLELGFDSFVIFGACGGRPDHTLANYQLAASLAERGCRVILACDDISVTALHNGTLELDPSLSGYISVFAHSDVCEGVCEKGLKYELDNVKLKNTFALGVSNEFTGVPARVSVKKGTLLIMYHIDFA